MEFQDEDVQIPEKKLKGYLLSVSHPHGRSKAKWFHERGFVPENSTKLKEELIKIFRNGKLVEKIESEHGMKYIVIGAIDLVEGGSAELKTVWIKEPDANFFRLVTAYPAGVE